ncbi:hypothetical protein SEA_CEN1621_31 [Microbacterium phage Cen1621]|uniref:Uncharacterized protein n=1 Tax=Microbacterium phage Cen1621 TaxID=2965191 RepID=A0A9E7TXM8_9CAUD|nr:hypothetical protein SEA_CEN1621_31 [Microbacterium phage Cen1621]
MTATPRKPRPLGPVHIAPEAPRKLAAGARVALAADPSLRGKVRTVNPGERHVIEWEDGTTSVEVRSALLSLFTTQTRQPRSRKGAA